MRHQRGNILFLILLAVVLFAALSYAVTQSLRGGGKDVTDEKASAIAAEIFQYASLLENAVTRLRLTNSCSDSQISFQNNIVGGYTNTFSPDDKRCHVFEAAGAGVAWKNPSVSWLDPYFADAPWGTSFLFGQSFFSNHTAVKDVGTHSLTNDLSVSDIIYEIPFLTDNICKAINDKAGLPFPITNASGGIVDVGKFTGKYSGCALPTACNLRMHPVSGSTPIVASTFCITGTWSSGNPEPGKTLNMFVHVLLPR